MMWILFLVGSYPYLGYPLLAYVLGELRRRSVSANSEYRCSTTVVISAFNEAGSIRETVLNKLQQTYPAELLDVLVISDGSDDGTDEIVLAIANDQPRVKLIRQEPRKGKTAAINLAMEKVTSQIVVFSDANSMYHSRAIERLIANFADPSVGYVTGSMRYVTKEGSLVGDGCDGYMRYENWLREVETRIGSVVGVDGGIDAVRRSLFQRMRPDQLPDFVLPLRVVAQGARVVYEPTAILEEESLSASASEYRMRVRVALRAFWAIWDERRLLNPARFGVFSFQLWSHKLLRYLSFLPLTTFLVLSFLQFHQSWLLKAVLVGEALFAILVALAGLGIRRVLGLPLPTYCHYFALLNWTSAVAFLQFLRGKKKVLWAPRQG